MHLTQEHTPMPNATPGLRPTRNFLHLCEQSKSLLPGRRWALGHRGFRGLGQAAQTPEGTELEGLTNPVSVDNLFGVTTLWRFDNDGANLGSHLVWS